MDACAIVREWCQEIVHHLNDMMIAILAILRYRLGWPIPLNLLVKVPAKYKGFVVNRFHEWSWFNIKTDVEKLRSVIEMINLQGLCLRT